MAKGGKDPSCHEGSSPQLPLQWGGKLLTLSAITILSQTFNKTSYIFYPTLTEKLHVHELHPIFKHTSLAIIQAFIRAA